MTIAPSIAAGCMVGLVLGNFAYQAVTSKAWAVAIDRSYFQVLAVAVLMLVAWISQKA